MSGVGTIEAEALQDLANLNLEETLQQTIDVERFEAVAEHSGNLQRLIERYGDNPGSCPYIKSMGEAGIQLVQKLVEAEKNPDRGPTIRELMEAKKKEAQSQVTITEKPNSVKNIDTTAAKTDRKVDKKTGGTIETDKGVERVFAQHVSIIMSEPAEEHTGPTTKLYEVTKEPKLKLVEKSLPYLATTEAEGILRQQVFDISVRRVAEIEYTPNKISSVTEDVTEATVFRASPVRRPVKIEGTIHTKERHELAGEVAAKVPDIEIIDNTRDLETIGLGGVELSINLETTSTEDTPSDVDETLKDLGLEYSAPEEIDLDSMTVLDEVDHNFEPEMSVSQIESAIELVGASGIELEEPHHLQAELSTHTESLGPDKAVVVETALKSFIESLEADYSEIEVGAESSVIKVKETEHLFVKLLDVLELDYESPTVKRLMHELLTPEFLAKTTEGYELSIDQLNYLGTREYKQISVASLFASLAQMIKQKIEARLSLGKCALSASTA